MMMMIMIMMMNYPKCQASSARFVKEGEQIMRVWADVVWTYRDLIADYVADYDDIDDDGDDENICCLKIQEVIWFDDDDE